MVAVLETFFTLRDNDVILVVSSYYTLIISKFFVGVSTNALALLVSSKFLQFGYFSYTSSKPRI